MSTTTDRARVYARPVPDEAELGALEQLAARRLRFALGLTAAMLVVYFGFILLIAFAPDFLGKRIIRG